MIGREAELEQIAIGVQGVLRGEGGAIFLIGEGGIGKSRLAAEAADKARREGLAVVGGRASRGRVEPFSPLVATLVRGARRLPGSGMGTDPVLRAGLRALRIDRPEGPATPVSPLLIAETVLRLAARLGNGRGSVVVLEDLQWADADTLAVIDYLADSISTEHVLLLATSRPEATAMELSAELEVRRVARTLNLDYLTEEQTREMIGACLGDVPVPDQVVELVTRQADRLPFLVEELLASLIRDGSLTTTDDGWVAAEELEVRVPLSFVESVSDRLIASGDDTTLVVRSAAVLGRDFDHALIAELTGLSERAVLAAITDAVDGQLMEPVGTRRFRFRHALTVDAVLADMSESEQARIASMALEVVTRGHADRRSLTGATPTDPGLVAHLAAFSGDWVLAARILIDEAERALAAGAAGTAEANARQAVEVAPAGGPEHLLAREVHLRALELRGDAVAVQELGWELLADLDRIGADPAKRASVLLTLARASMASGDLQQATQLCEEGLRLTTGQERLQAEIRMTMATIAFDDRRHEEAVQEASAVLAIADEREHPDLACQALELLGRHRLLVTMQLRAAEGYLRRALLRARRARLVAWEIRTLLHLAYVDIGWLKGPVRIEQARQLAEQAGVLALCADLDHLLATSHLTSHDLDLADAAAERALRQAQRYRMTELSAVAEGIRATILAVRGQRPESEALVVEALKRTSDPQLQAAISGSALVLAALAVNDLRAAARHVDAVRRGLPADRVLVQPLFLGMFFGVAAVVRALEGRVLEQGRDWVEMDDVFMHGSFQIARAIETGRQGDAAAAAALFAAGDQQLTRAPWVQAVYRRYAAEAAADDGWGEPEVWLAAAEAFFVASGSAELAAACQGLRAGSSTSDWRLTPREQDVLALVVEGFTNKEIASQLFLSTRTVEKHVERLLAKSGQPNRTSLGRHATRGTIAHREMPQRKP